MTSVPPAATEAQPPARTLTKFQADLTACAATLCGVAAQAQALEDEREAATTTYLNLMRELRAVGDVEFLIEVTQYFRAIYGSGWTTRLKEFGLPDLQALTAEFRGLCNDGEGGWRGPFPLRVGDPRPTVGTWVVYQLLLRGELLYIGSTGSLYTRLKAHSREKEFDSWRASRCDSERQCRDLETALIDRYRPPLNRMIPTPRVVLV